MASLVVECNGQQYLLERGKEINVYDIDLSEYAVQKILDNRHKTVIGSQTGAGGDVCRLIGLDEECASKIQFYE